MSRKLSLSVVFVLLVLFTAFLVQPSEAGFLKDTVGRVGGYVFGSTIDDAEAAGNRVVANFKAEADKVLKDADELVRARLNDLNAILGHMMTKADDTANNAIEETFSRMLKGIAEADKRFQETITVGGRTLDRSTLKFIGFAWLLIACAFLLVLLRDLGKHQKPRTKPLAYGLAGSTAVVFVALYVASEAPSSCIDISDIDSQISDIYSEMYAKRDFLQARARATGRSTTPGSYCKTGNEPMWYFREHKAKHLANITLNPATYSSPTRSEATALAIRALIKAPFGEPDVGVSRLDLSDLYSALALIDWMSGSGRTQDARAALNAYESLQGLVQEERKDTADITDLAVLSPIALHIADQYLGHPHSQEELASTGLFNDAEQIILLRQLGPLTEQVRPLVMQATLYKTDEHAAYMDYASYVESFRTTLVSNYVCMVDNNAKARPWLPEKSTANTSGLFGKFFSQLTPYSNSAEHMAERDKCAQNIVNLYEGPDHPDGRYAFTRKVLSREYNGTGIRLNALLGPHAILERARSYLEYDQTVYQGINCVTHNQYRKVEVQIDKGRLGLDKPKIEIVWDFTGSNVAKHYPKTYDPTPNCWGMGADIWTAVPPLRPAKKSEEESPTLQLLSSLPRADADEDLTLILEADLKRTLAAELKTLVDFEKDYTDLIEFRLSSPLLKIVESAVSKKSLAARYNKVAEEAGKLGLFVCEGTSFACDLDHLVRPRLIPLPTALIDIVSDEQNPLLQPVGLHQSAEARVWPTT